MPTVRSTAPATAPSAATNLDTIEIIKTTQSRRELYPDLNTPEDLNNYKYSDLMKPLKAKPQSMQSHHKAFHDSLSKLEKKIAKYALSNFSYTKAEAVAVARPAEKQLFDDYQNQVSRISAAAMAPGAGMTTTPPPPHKDTLFSALSMADFNTNMNNTTIVNPLFKGDRAFRNAAEAVMKHILKYRNDNKQTLQDETVYQYLDKIFDAKQDQIEIEIDNSSIISSSSFSPEVRASIIKDWNVYYEYRKRIRRGLIVEKNVKEQKSTILSKPFEAARGGIRFLAQKIEGFRANWAGMDGKERFIAGSAIVLGLAWFLNTDNEKASQFRDILGKAGLIIIGAMGANAVAKVVTGQSGETLLKGALANAAGKNDMMKKGFDLDAKGARIMNDSVGVLGNYDFSELGSLYLEQQAKYKAYNIKDELKELPVGGVAENEMSANQMFMAMRYLDTKLKKQGSSVEKIVKALEEMQAKAKLENKPFTMPTYSMIVTASLIKSKVIVFDKKGKPSFAPDNVEVKFTSTDRDYTRKWWMFIGGPSDWRAQIAKTIPQEFPNIDNLKAITSDVIPAGSNLTSYITGNKFGRYTKGFTDLYNNKISSKPNQRVYYQTTTDGDGYMASRVKVNPNLTSRNQAKVAAIKSAYDNALQTFEKYLNKNKPALFNKIKSRLHEFIQPVGGVMIAPGYKGKDGKVLDKNKPQEYFMFCRYVLPPSREFELRFKKEWPNSDMYSQMKVKDILKRVQNLTIGDFHTFARERRFKYRKPNGDSSKIFYMPIFDGFDSKFTGAYESFLANYGLKKSETSKIQKVLDEYSKDFAGSGVTKQGLVRYLAAHQPTADELKKYLGAVPVPHFPWITTVVRNATGGSLPTARRLATLTNDEVVEVKKDVFSKFGTVMILACYGDQGALEAIKKVDDKLYNSILATFKFRPGGSPAGDTKQEDFIDKVLPHYLEGVFRMYSNASKRNAAMGTVGEYLSRTS